MCAHLLLQSRKCEEVDVQPSVQPARIWMRKMTPIYSETTHVMGCTLVHQLHFACKFALKPCKLALKPWH